MRNSLSGSRGKPPWKPSGRPLATPAMPPAKLGSEKADRSSVDRSTKDASADLPRRNHPHFGAASHPFRELDAADARWCPYMGCARKTRGRPTEGMLASAAARVGRDEVRALGSASENKGLPGLVAGGSRFQVRSRLVRQRTWLTLQPKAMFARNNAHEW